MFRGSEVGHIKALEISGRILRELWRTWNIARQEQINAVVHVECLFDEDDIPGEH